jgi:transcriptional regulator NrdR family protein
MSDLEVVLGQGKPKIQIGEDTYLVSPLRLQDFGEFREWVKEKRLGTFMRAAKKMDLDADAFDRAIQKILSVTPVVEGEGDNATVSDDVIAQMGTEEGMEYLVYLSIRRNHPDIELDDLDLDFGDLEKLTSIIAEISGLPTPDESESENARPTEKA